MSARLPTAEDAGLQETHEQHQAMHGSRSTRDHLRLLMGGGAGVGQRRPQDRLRRRTKLLPSRLREEVDRLTATYETPDGWNYDYFTAGCTFPDLARRRARNKVPGWDYFKQFSNWHYLNVPRSTDEISADESCGNCILEGIELHWDQLANEDLEDWQRAQALFFLGHWVGDLHQPLHVSYGDDLGGNDVDGAYGAYHLHGVWDSGIISRARHGADWWA